ncbi:glutamate racemase [bacterium]|nr:glutamate racemase [bacterium]NBX49544.1 glutamate racemase [bacterium]
MSTLGVFDSGLGGLTVVKEIKKQFPDCSIIYLGDTARVPYGPRGKEVITQFALESVRFLEQCEVDAIVIACNTVSALAADEIKKRVHIPVYEMILPAVAEAKQATRNKKIGVIGTRATIGSHAYKTHLEGYEVTEQACPLFVPFVEEGEFEGKIIELLAERYLGFVKEKEIDTLILGCTHYPLLAEVIQKIVGPKVTLIHCGEAVVKELQVSAGKKADQFFITDLTSRYQELGSMILGKKVTIERAII